MVWRNRREKCPICVKMYPTMCFMSIVINNFPFPKTNRIWNEEKSSVSANRLYWIRIRSGNSVSNLLQFGVKFHARCTSREYKVILFSRVKNLNCNICTQIRTGAGEETELKLLGRRIESIQGPNKQGWR